jgi:hypothetical protein
MTMTTVMMMHDTSSHKTLLGENEFACICRPGSRMRCWSVRLPLFAVDENENWKEHCSHCPSAERQASQAFALTSAVAVTVGMDGTADLPEEDPITYPTCLLVLTAVSTRA